MAEVRNYAPTKVELNEAIDVYLQAHANAEAKEVCAALMRANGNWKLPERRVAKFVKRQKKVDPSGADDDSSIGKVTRRMMGASRKVIRSNWFKGSKKNAESSSNRKLGLLGKSITTTTTAANNNTKNGPAAEETAPPKKAAAAQEPVKVDVQPTAPNSPATPTPKQEHSSLSATAVDVDNPPADVVEVEDHPVAVATPVVVQDKQVDLVYVDEDAVAEQGSTSKKGDCLAPCEGCTIL